MYFIGKILGSIMIILGGYFFDFESPEKATACFTGAMALILLWSEKYD